MDMIPGVWEYAEVEKMDQHVMSNRYILPGIMFFLFHWIL